MTAEQAGLFVGDALGTLLIGAFAWSLALLGRLFWSGPTEEQHACPRCGCDFHPDEYLTEKPGGGLVKAAAWRTSAGRRTGRPAAGGQLQ